jgi:hypothetical protein
MQGRLRGCEIWNVALFLAQQGARFPLTLTRQSIKTTTQTMAKGTYLNKRVRRKLTHYAWPLVANFQIANREKWNTIPVRNLVWRAPAVP